MREKNMYTNRETEGVKTSTKLAYQHHAPPY